MTETVTLFLSLAALLVAGSIALMCLVAVGYIGLRAVPFVQALRKPQDDGKNYVHPDTGEACTLSEALSAEENAFSGKVPMAAWGKAVSRYRN